MTTAQVAQFDLDQWISRVQYGIVMADPPDPEPSSVPDPEPIPEPEPTPDPVPESIPEPDPTSEPEPAPVAVKPDWRERQLGKVRGENKDLKARVAELTAELEPFKQNQQPKPTTGLTEAEVERRAEERARAIAAEQSFARDIQSVVETGKATFADWEPQMNQLAQLVDQTNPQSTASYTAMVQAALATGAAPQVLHALSLDLNEAQRILDLPPMQMGIELTKIALKPASELSGAPRPIRPVGGTGQASRSEIRPDDPDRADTLNIDEWMRRRNAQVNASNGRAA